MSARPAGGGAALGTLAARLAALEVTVESAFALALGVWATDYPGGWRPSGLLSLGGLGCLGRSEPVAFDSGQQARCADRILAALPPGRATVGSWMTAFPVGDEAARWCRAAAEAALIDLALRQAGRSLAALAGAPERVEIEFVVSFDACAEPAARVRSLQPDFPSSRFKVDVDPGWSDEAVAALSRTGRVAVLDFKGRGDAATCDRIAAQLPGALVEDPPPGASLPPHRVSRDQPLVERAAVEGAVAAGETLNLKAPRLGGVIATLEAAALALEAGTPCFVGGMSEVGVGRRQARALAALISPSGGNDLAPMRGVERLDGANRLRVDLSRPGLGA